MSDTEQLKVVPKSSRFFKPKNRRARIALVPSLLTGVGLFSGFFSIVLCFREVMGIGIGFAPAGLAIIIASFIDGLDGRLARLMKAETKFGFQFDSIADVVSFGVAPAVLVYSSTLYPLDRWGLLGAFLYVACAAVRLARFNVLSEENPSSRKYFKGMSSPVAAGAVALTALIESPFSESVHQAMVLGWTIFLSLLMVSNIRFRAFKQMEFASRRPLFTFMVFIFLIVLIFSFQEYALLGIFLVYLSWGLGEEFVLFRRRRRSDPSIPFVPFGERGRTDNPPKS